MLKMTKHDMFYEGKNLWFEYIKVNDYAFTPTEKGLTKLSRQLDLNKSFIRKCINIYLEAQKSNVITPIKA